MSKKILSILLVLSMALTMLTACNNEPVENTDDPKDQQQEEVVFPETVDLVVDGVSEYVIVRGENAYISEVTASTELQSYLKQMTGVEIPIVTDSTEAVEKEIVVGKTNRETEGEFNREELGDDGLVIKTKGEKLFLVGGEQRGTLYAVYEFLEAYLGCRFYTNEIEKVPETKTISLEQIEEDKQIPVFIWRYNSQDEWLSESLRAKRRNNQNVSDTYGGDFGWATWCHTFVDLVPFSQYYNEHPEYFTVTEKEYNEGNYGQLCLTNPEVLAIATETARSILQKCTDEKIISITQNDNQKYCTCDNCMALCESEGSFAAATLKFTNDIANALKDEFPDMLFDTFAYQYTRNVPKTITPAENVVVRLCSIEECFNHPLSEDVDILNSSDAMVKNSFMQDITDWAAIADNLFIWDYSVNYTDYEAPHANLDIILDNIRFFADNNVKGVMAEGKDYRSAEFHELRIYMISKCLWDPYMTKEEYYEIMWDFIEGVYGPAGEYIKEFIDYIHEVTEQEDLHFGCFYDAEDAYNLGKAVEIHKQKEYPQDLTSDMIRNYENVDWSQYWNFFRDIPETPEIIIKGRELFNKAYEAAETEIQKSMVDKNSIQIDVLESIFIWKRLSYGGSAIGKILINYFNANPDEFTYDEQVEFRIAIVNSAREQAYAKYEEFNQKLYEKLLKYNVKQVHINTKPIDTATLDFTNLPREWVVED